MFSDILNYWQAAYRLVFPFLAKISGLKLFLNIYVDTGIVVYLSMKQYYALSAM